MPRILAPFVLLIVVLAATAPEAWAQAAAELSCDRTSSAAECPEAAGSGAWGLIFLGAIFFAVWFMPPRRTSERGSGLMDSLPMLGTLQRRIDKELTGWRRFQWPVIGLFFMALGFAFLFGWI
jgi:hypothetical protein